MKGVKRIKAVKAAKGLLHIAVWSLLFAGGAAVADDEAEAKHRHYVMEAVGGHMGSMAVILRSGLHMEDLAVHAEAIATLAKIAPNIFPEGSNTEKSHALDVIWEDPKGFGEAMGAFGEAADNVAAAVESGDMSKIGAAIQALGDTCKGCHDNYKEK